MHACATRSQWLNHRKLDFWQHSPIRLALFERRHTPANGNFLHELTPMRTFCYAMTSSSLPVRGDGYVNRISFLKVKINITRPLLATGGYFTVCFAIYTRLKADVFMLSTNPRVNGFVLHGANHKWHVSSPLCKNFISRQWVYCFLWICIDIHVFLYWLYHKLIWIKPFPIPFSVACLTLGQLLPQDQWSTAECFQ